jgi:hypothetical protein
MQVDVGTDKDKEKVYVDTETPAGIERDTLVDM